MRKLLSLAAGAGLLAMAAGAAPAVADSTPAPGASCVAGNPPVGVDAPAGAPSVTASFECTFTGDGAQTNAVIGEVSAGKWAITHQAPGAGPFGGGTVVDYSGGPGAVAVGPGALFSGGTVYTVTMFGAQGYLAAGDLNPTG
jgi:hypothetical protein